MPQSTSTRSSPAESSVREPVTVPAAPRKLSVNGWCGVMPAPVSRMEIGRVTPTHQGFALTEGEKAFEFQAGQVGGLRHDMGPGALVGEEHAPHIEGAASVDVT